MFSMLNNALADKIACRPVTCEDLGRDRYKRIIARCTVAGEDLEKWMVANGWAFGLSPIFARLR